MKFLGLFLMLFSVAAFADLDLGMYHGTTSTGDLCTLEVKGVSFENNVKHPLNERVSVLLGVDGEAWTVAHPPVISVENSKVRFDHNIFEGVKPVRTNEFFGAKYLKMIIDHDNEPHRPTSYLFVEDNYKEGAETVKVECSNLVKVEY